MFRDCTSLHQAPALPATTLANNCYSYMFDGCTSLIQVPALPATTLANWCYQRMFYGCISLELSSTQTGEYTQEYRIPSSGKGVTARDALKDMFTSTGGTFTGTPAVNTTYYLSSNNMVVRETEIATLNGYVGSMIDAISIPEKLPNPHALTFTGAVSGSYDGSAAKTINIPSGGGDIALGITGATVGQIAKITAVDGTGKPTAWEAVDMASGGDEWDLIAHINVADDVEKGVTVWEYNNLPRYKYIAYKKVNFVGSSMQTASGCMITINNESTQPSGISYGKSGSPQSGMGMIYVMPFGWAHCKTGDSVVPTNYSFGNVFATYNALPLSDNAITSIRLSENPTYKIASGEIWLYGKKG